jgi:hypothetical protein
MNGADKIGKRTKQEVRQERLRVLREMAALLEEEERETTSVPRDGRLASATTIEPDLSYAQKPLAVSIPEYLATCKEPQTTKQIATALRKAGRDFETANPVHAVRTMLRRAMGSNPDIFHVGWAKWYLKSKCTKKQLEKHAANNVNLGTGGRSKREHAKRTADGIKKRRSAGASWGPREKGTPELIENAKEMLRNGVTLGVVCRTLKVSTATLYKHGIHQRELKKEGKRQQELALVEQTEADNVVRFAKS